MGGGLNITFYVRDPEKAHPCQNREFWRIMRQNPPRCLGCSELQEPPTPKTNTFWCAIWRVVTHARKRNPWADCDELLHRCRGPQRNHLCQFLSLPHTGFRLGGGGQILGFSIDLTCIVALTTLSRVCDCIVAL